MKLITLIAGALALASSTYAIANATFCVDSNTICYVVNVPESTSSNGGTGDFFFQISGPSSMRWIGFGQGSQMTGANMFVVYADAAGTNVTLSPRHGAGEFEPLEDTTTNVTLLGGSGISNGQMVANVLCSSCNKWTGGDTMNFDSTSAAFIWSYLSGPPINSDSPSATITQHDLMGTANFDLATAAGGSGSNPFLATADASTSGTGSGDNSGEGDGHGPGGSGAPGFGGSNGSPGFSGSSGTSGGESEIGSRHFLNILKAHGIIGGTTFAIILPLGAIAIRLFSFPGLVYLHAAWQILALILAFATLGLGVWLAHSYDLYHYINKAHPIIGIVVVSALILQPFTGLAHHIIFRRRTRSPNVATYPHVWWGRIFITLGIINGGLGLELANDSHGGRIAYAVVAGTMWALWMLTILISAFRGRGAGAMAKRTPDANSDRNREISGGESSVTSPRGDLSSRSDMREELRRERRYK